MKTGRSTRASLKHQRVKRKEQRRRETGGRTILHDSGYLGGGNKEVLLGGLKLSEVSKKTAERAFLRLQKAKEDLEVNNA